MAGSCELLFPFLCCAFYIIGCACSSFGFDVEYDAKFTIIAGRNSCSCEGPCIESCGSFWCDFGCWLVRMAQKPVVMGTAWWLPKLPKTAAVFVNRPNEFDTGHDQHVWQVW